jgi:hypothetical protein
MISMLLGKIAKKQNYDITIVGLWHAMDMSGTA